MTSFVVGVLFYLTALLLVEGVDAGPHLAMFIGWTAGCIGVHIGRSLP